MYESAKALSSRHQSAVVDAEILRVRGKAAVSGLEKHKAVALVDTALTGSLKRLLKVRL